MKKLISLLITLFLLNAGNALADHHGYVQTDLLEKRSIVGLLSLVLKKIRRCVPYFQYLF